MDSRNACKIVKTLRSGMLPCPFIPMRYRHIHPSVANQKRQINGETAGTRTNNNGEL